MLKRNTISFLAVAIFFSAGAGAECIAPEMVSVPEGAKATEEEMTEGQEYIREFMAANDKYRKCLDEEIASLGEEATDEAKIASNQLYNTSVDREQALVDSYNEQVRAFNEANP